MKFYCVAHQDVDQGVVLEWFTSLREAKKCARDHQEDYMDTRHVDVPTDQAGLLAWLNSNCRGETG